jgi:hypothetical protein
VLHLTLVALYTFSRVSGSDGGVGKMDALDWSFIAWAFLGHTVDLLARLAIQWVVVPRLFDKYLASLDGDAFCDDDDDDEDRGQVYSGKGAPAGARRRRRRRRRSFFGVAGPRWYHRARIKLRWWRYGNRYKRGEEEGQEGESAEYGRLEPHLLGDMEGRI